MKLFNRVTDGEDREVNLTARNFEAVILPFLCLNQSGVRDCKRVASSRYLDSSEVTDNLFNVVRDSSLNSDLLRRFSRLSREVSKKGSF